MLPLPDTPTNSLKLADWLELQALLSPDGNSSRGDLAGALRIATLFIYNEIEMIEQKLVEVFSELEQREKAAKEAYPFKIIDYSVLQLRSDWQDFPPYIFCLNLSYFGWPQQRNEAINPRKLFEQVSCLAAHKFLQGNSIGFGFPRIELPSSFPEAITALCKLIGEGECYRDQSSLDRKDDALDLVVWKEFADKLPSKILMFGQCASGWDWEDKLTELQPRAFWSNWIREPHVSSLIKSFFIPHRVERQKWEWAARNAGIIFDRCRIAFWAHNVEETDYSPYLEWSHNQLRKII